MHVCHHTDKVYISSMVAILFYTESVTLGLISNNKNTLESFKCLIRKYSSPCYRATKIFPLDSSLSFISTPLIVLLIDKIEMTLPTLDSDVGSQLCLNHQRWPPPSGAKGTFRAFEMNGSVTEERVGDTATDRPALRVPSSRRADALFVALSLVSSSTRILLQHDTLHRNLTRKFVSVGPRFFRSRAASPFETTRVTVNVSCQSPEECETRSKKIRRIIPE